MRAGVVRALACNFQVSCEEPIYLSIEIATGMLHDLGSCISSTFVIFVKCAFDINKSQM